MKNKTSINDVVDELIAATAKILTHKARVALGEEPSEDAHKFCKNEMAEILKIATPLIQACQVSRGLEANSSSEVVKMLSEGKITPAEAVALLKLVKDKVEVEAKEMEHQIKMEIVGHD